MGDRSFGSNVTQVAELCIEACEAIIENGGVPVVKHIPGHGRATVDSHIVLPYVNTTLDELEKTDFAVFRQIAEHDSEQNYWAMAAHILYEALDANKPVTLSPNAVKFIRENIGFKGTLVTDAIEMGAMHGILGAKYQLVTKLLSIDEQDASHAQLISMFIDAGIIGDKDEAQTLKQQAEEIKSNFRDSLIDVAQQALTAGYDLVFHCTGEIEQMTALCGAVESNYDLVV